MALESLSDDEVLSGLDAVLRQSRRVESSLIAHLAEVDARRLFARYASPSMFLYCRDVLHLSEGEAQLRITVAKAAREHPVLLEMLGDGRLHLSGIARLAPILTPENRDRLLARAVHRSKRQIEEMVAELAPRPDAPSRIRKVPERMPRHASLELPRPAPAPIQPAEIGVEPPVVPDVPIRPDFTLIAPARRPCSSRFPRRGTRSSSPPAPTCGTTSKP